MGKEKISARQITAGLKSALIAAGAANLGNAETLDKLINDLVEPNIIDLVKNKCAEQRQICADTGKHHKFGFYRYKKEEMLNAETPKFE